MTRPIDIRIRRSAAGDGARRVSAAACFIIASLFASAAMADIVTRESDITSLRLGQHVLVDDASCPAGQIKEIVGMRLTPAGVERGKKCIERKGARR